MKKRILVIGGIVVLVLLLVGAAFVGGQLLSGQGLPGLASGGGLQFASAKGGGSQMGFPHQIQPAKELPQTQADARGIFENRKDNSIFVGTGNVHMTMQREQNGQVTTSATHDGPTVEVVVMTKTIVYRDVTFNQFNDAPPGKVQQVVEPGDLAEVGEQSSITVWGNKTGDRIIADVLVYTPPGQ